MTIIGAMSNGGVQRKDGAQVAAEAVAEMLHMGQAGPIEVKPDETGETIEMRVFDLPDVPEEARAAISLRAYGLETKAISQKLGITENTVRNYIRKYKLEDAGEDGAKLRKMLLAGMFETIAMECLSRITKKDINKMDGGNKFSTAMQSVRIMKELRTKPVKKTKNVHDIVKGMTNGASEKEDDK